MKENTEQEQQQHTTIKTSHIVIFLIGIVVCSIAIFLATLYLFQNITPTSIAVFIVILVVFFVFPVILLLIFYFTKLRKLPAATKKEQKTLELLRVEQPEQ